MSIQYCMDTQYFNDSRVSSVWGYDAPYKGYYLGGKHLVVSEVTAKMYNLWITHYLCTVCINLVRHYHHNSAQCTTIVLWICITLA